MRRNKQDQLGISLAGKPHDVQHRQTNEGENKSPGSNSTAQKPTKRQQTLSTTSRSLRWSTRGRTLRHDTCAGSSRWTIGSRAPFRLLRDRGSSRSLPTSRASWTLSPKFQRGFIRLSPDGRLPHIPSLIRAAAWEERCSGVEGGCVLSPPGSAEEKHAGLSLAECEEGRQAGSGLLIRNVSTLPKSRQQRSLTWKISLLGVFEVRWVTPNLFPCGSGPA